MTSQYFDRFQIVIELFRFVLFVLQLLRDVLCSISGTSKENSHNSHLV